MKATIALVLVLAAAAGFTLGDVSFRAHGHAGHGDTSRRSGDTSHGSGYAAYGSGGTAHASGDRGSAGARTEAAGGREAALAARARASSSRSGLPLGTPPLALAPSSPADTLRVWFRHEPRAGLVFDLDSGRVLWQRAATRVLPVASLVKMMTALLAVRSLPDGAHVLISRRAANAAGSKVGLLPVNRRVPLQALLDGLLLPSGNDAAIALAEAVSGSVSRFVRRMNAQAARLGLGCTRFTSPDGLDDGNSSCAIDLAELAVVDLAQPRIAAIVRSASAIVPFPIKGGRLYLYNNNPLLRYRYPGATGLKTGETVAAGLCLVGTAERDHVRLGVVLLHSPELGRQAEALLNAAFEQAYRQPHIAGPPVPKGR